MGQTGRIEVIVGGMYGGKTEELIRRLNRARIARQSIQVFKPVIDDRYHVSDIMSHDQKAIPAIAVASSQDIFKHILDDTDVIGIDEGQFFDSELVDVCQHLADLGVRVIVAGLDTDWKAKPFGPMPALMAVAEEVTKQHAVCMICGQTASRTQRIAPTNERIVVGGAGVYEARCRAHFKPEVQVPLETAPVPQNFTN